MTGQCWNGAGTTLAAESVLNRSIRQFQHPSILYNVRVPGEVPSGPIRRLLLDVGGLAEVDGVELGAFASVAAAMEMDT